MQLGKLEVGINAPLSKFIKHSHCSKQRDAAKLALTEPAKQREPARDETGPTGTALPRQRMEMEKYRMCLILPYSLSKIREISTLQLFFPNLSYLMVVILVCTGEEDTLDSLAAVP